MATDLPPDLRSRFRGCFLGGAVGDALGAPVEFLRHAAIVARFGVGGPVDFAPAYGTVGAVTDDTQMTLWTAEGLLRARHRWETRGICHVPSVVRHAYLRWLATQERVPGLPSHVRDGWLWEQVSASPGLGVPRAPGETCLAALRDPRVGSPDGPLNHSKGCGGVMRAAPAGLLVPAHSAFDLGVEVAALTHGHPSGYLAAGALALAIALLRDGEAIPDALTAAEDATRARTDGAETADALADARRLADSGLSDLQAIHLLARANPPAGPGWVAEEALAVAAFVARRHPSDAERAIRAAVTHSGDSDSTGAIAGNLLGAALGEAALPARWVATVELRDLTLQVADDLYAAYTGARGWQARYPPA